MSLSVLIALGAATVALWLTLRLQNLFQKTVAAIAMGLAISGMHYTGMAAATFAAMPDGDHGTTSVGQANSRNLERDEITLKSAFLGFRDAGAI